MRLRPRGRNLADDSQRARIDERDRLIDLSSHIEQAVLWPNQHAVRTYAVAEIDGVDNFARRQINHRELTAIAPRLPHARIAVDGHIREAAIARSNHLVSGHA